MSLIRLALRNVFRNRARGFLAVGSTGIFVLAITLILTITASFQHDLEQRGRSLRLCVRSAASLAELLPDRYRDTLAAFGTRDITCVQGYTWFGGIVPGRERELFPTIALDVEPLREMWDDYKIDDPTWSRFREDRAGAIAGAKLAARMGWEAGRTRITLQSNVYRCRVTLNLVGISHGPYENNLIFSSKLLEDLAGAPRGVTVFWVKVRSRERLGKVADAIDEAFKDDEVATKTETEKAFTAGFLAMLGNVGRALQTIGGAICAVLVLLSTNVAALSARERVREIAVLKALGFQPRHVAFLCIAEAALVAALGALTGAVAAVVLLRVLDLGAKAGFIGGILSGFAVDAKTLGLALASAVVAAILGASLPALRAARLRTVEGLARPD